MATVAVPPGVFQRFEVWAGLHCELGASGNVAFEVMGNGTRLASTGPLLGNAPAVRLIVPLVGITKLQLIAKSAGERVPAPANPDLAVHTENTN